MSQESAFDSKTIEEAALDHPPGLLEQFNLPPQVIKYIRENRQKLWIAAGCIAFVVVALSLWDQYAERRAEKASSALSMALQAEEDQKQEQLAKVVDEYGSTSAGLWGRIELAHLAVEKGEVDKAIRELNEIKGDVSAKNPVMPLLLHILGALYEKNNELDKAVNAFTELSAFKPFELGAFEALGRLHEAQGQKDKALEMYKKALGADPATTGPAQQSVNPNRETIQARILFLQG